MEYTLSHIHIGDIPWSEADSKIGRKLFTETTVQKEGAQPEYK